MTKAKQDLGHDLSEKTEISTNHIHRQFAHTKGHGSATSTSCPPLGRKPPPHNSLTSFLHPHNSLASNLPFIRVIFAEAAIMSTALVRASVGWPLQSHARLMSTSAARLLPASFTGSSAVPSYFQKSRLPANTVVRFVPQQTAWIVERMGKFNRILEPGLAILAPFIDRISYVKSLKEVAIEIPSQSAITADNVTLELDGVLFTRVFDAYKARYVSFVHELALLPVVANMVFSTLATVLKMPSMPSHSSPRRQCARKSDN